MKNQILSHKPGDCIIKTASVLSRGEFQVLEADDTLPKLAALLMWVGKHVATQRLPVTMRLRQRWSDDAEYNSAINVLEDAGVMIQVIS